MRSLSGNSKVEPLIKEVHTPLGAPQAFELIKDRPFSFFLDSGMNPEKLGRYSFMGCDPFLVLKSQGEEITLLDKGEPKIIRGNPFDVLEKLLKKYEVEPGPSPVPLVGGAVGYLSYDLCHFMERLPSTARDDLVLPEAYLALYDAIVTFDHLEGKAYIASTGFPEGEEDRRKTRARARLLELENLLSQATDLSAEENLYLEESMPGGAEIRSNFTHEEYLRAVERAREYIAAGDIFQVNLSQRFEAELSIPPYELYRRLRRINPAPFACYLNFDDLAVVSASPERFLQVKGNLAETRPIKGTRPRGKTAQEDETLARELVHSIKDQAEHVMIVDLERNDLGRVSRYGTVRVKELMTLERYATVFHLTSTVVGRLQPGKGRIDLLKACFPGGSVTGAPKVRAMEIIDELEPTKRSVYTGSIGYLSFSGEMDLNIAIRTFLVKGGRACFQVGGAVVYDSDPQGEYIETLDKAKALIQAISLSPEKERVRAASDPHH